MMAKNMLFSKSYVVNNIDNPHPQDIYTIVFIHLENGRR